MSGMHLLPAMYSTTGKKKGKKKWASAEAKRKAEQLQVEWQSKLKKWNMVVENKKRTRAVSAPKLSNSGPKIPPGRETPRIESKDTGWVPCTKKTDQTYTGTKVKGIGTMHKSNGVPIFSDDEAKDISSMRR
jgi:hypothetical protein